MSDEILDRFSYTYLMRIKSLCIEKNICRGGALTRPWILPKQNPSPQGENSIIFLRKIRNSPNFGGRVAAPPLQIRFH